MRNLYKPCECLVACCTALLQTHNRLNKAVTVLWPADLLYLGLLAQILRRSQFIEATIISMKDPWFSLRVLIQLSNLDMLVLCHMQKKKFMHLQKVSVNFFDKNIFVHYRDWQTFLVLDYFQTTVLMIAKLELILKL